MSAGLRRSAIAARYFASGFTGALSPAARAALGGFTKHATTAHAASQIAMTRFSIALLGIHGFLDRRRHGRKSGADAGGILAGALRQRGIASALAVDVRDDGSEQIFRRHAFLRRRGAGSDYDRHLADLWRRAHDADVRQFRSDR